MDRFPQRFQGRSNLARWGAVPHRPDLEADPPQGYRQFLGITPATFQRIEARLVKNVILIRRLPKPPEVHAAHASPQEIGLLPDVRNALDVNARVPDPRFSARRACPAAIVSSVIEEPGWTRRIEGSFGAT